MHTSSNNCFAVLGDITVCVLCVRVILLHGTKCQPMREETLDMVWSTTSSGEYHPLDGSTSMVR